MKISLPYGQEKQSVELDESILNGILVSQIEAYDPGKSQTELVKEALINPIDSKRLKDLAQGKNNVVIIASDHTRPVPSKIIMPLMLKEIREGNPDADITILIATGFHRLTTRQEMVSKFGEAIVDQEKIVVHDSGDEESLVKIGTLPSGGDLIINRLAQEADLLVSEGFIEPHFLPDFPEEEKACCRASPAGSRCWPTTAANLLLIPKQEQDPSRETRSISICFTQRKRQNWLSW